MKKYLALMVIPIMIGLSIRLDNLNIDHSYNYGPPFTKGSKIYEGTLGKERYRYSDQELKENIVDVSRCLDKVSQLRPVTFKYKQVIYDYPQGYLDSLASNQEISKGISPESLDNIPSDQSIQVGFIAQEVEILFPEVVHTSPQGNLYIDYVAIIPLLVKSIQEQQEQIDLLESKLNLLTTK